MSIEHRNIPEDGLHEPKGASNAAANRVYIATGTGTGEWRLVDADALKGLISLTDTAGLRVVTDGSGGFSTEPTPASSFGTMNLTGNTTSKTLTAATDTTLRTNTDYTPLDIALTYDSLTNMGSGSNYLQIQEAGLYVVDFWASIKSNTNTTKFALKFVLNDVDFVSRGPKFTLGNSGQIYNMSANGIHQFAANDQIKLYIAADRACNITIEDMTFQLLYVGEAI